ncbi:heme/hemin ABC transporter substrate-binding protein [Corynebacterium cystitidis]|uniref:heme/hemin ABC transporter substrate-binding protein n=1 Tax=Corynebacterium cystitidis TaxID=35757 RepID=UPI00211F31B6|nr:ABC transporter substrate-binding protein [Corynebacterium cystitidis]
MNHTRRILGASTALALALSMVACSNDAEPSNSSDPSSTSSTTSATDGSSTEQSSESNAGGHTFTGDDGNEITVESTERILVLDDATVDILEALEMNDSIAFAPESTMVKDKVSAAELFPAGKGAVTVEGVIEMNPSLVIGTNMRRHADLISGLQDAGIPATLIDASQPAPDIITKTATVVGKEEEGTELAKSVEEDIKQAEKNASDISEKKRVMVLSSRGAGDSGNTTAAGQQTPAHQIVEAAGGINTGAESGLDRYQTITGEGLAAAAPDVIVVSDDEIDDLGGEDGIWDHVDGLAGTPAAENKALVVMPHGLIARASVNTGKAALELQEALYPELS